MPEAKSNGEASDHGYKREQIIFAAGRARHAFKKLPAIEDAHAIKKHDQADEPDRSDDLRLRREGAESETHEQNGADAERKSADADLTDQIAEPDRKKGRENRLRADNFTRKVKHDPASVSFFVSSSS